jgi:hypothetical protein
MIRPLLVFWLILYSLRYRTRPWNFFQLNSSYFNARKNIFSKLEIDSYIPDKWLLAQKADTGGAVSGFPLFVKPEWGQNGHGVTVVRDQEELDRYRKKCLGRKVTYLLQEPAAGEREYEFFYIRDADNQDNCTILSLTETLNSTCEHPVVNSVLNDSTTYRDLTEQLGQQKLGMFWQMIKEVGCFRIARIGMSADSIENLFNGKFKIIEINIFLPMPLVLLDRGIRFSEKHLFIKKSMNATARLGKIAVKGINQREPIFFKKLVAHYRVKE